MLSGKRPPVSPCRDLPASEIRSVGKPEQVYMASGNQFENPNEVVMNDERQSLIDPV